MSCAISSEPTTIMTVCMWHLAYRRRQRDHNANLPVSNYPYGRMHIAWNPNGEQSLSLTLPEITPACAAGHRAPFSLTDLHISAITSSTSYILCYEIAKINKFTAILFISPSSLFQNPI